MLFVITALFSIHYFYTQHQNNNTTKGKLTKQQRIEEAFKLEQLKTKDPKLDRVPTERLAKARSYTAQLLQEKNAIEGVVWEERGPNNVGGRTRAILIDSNDPTYNTVFAGGVAGGLWRTTNFKSNAIQWTAIDDFFENLAVTAIVQDDVNPSVMYFGTGEGWLNSNAVRGKGIWKSEDGGQSWNQLPSTDRSDFYYVQDLIIDRNGALYASTRSGLMRSTNGGNSWTRVLSGRATDLELGADGDLYAAVGIFSAGRVWKSDAQTNGNSLGANGNWQNITPNGSYSRIEMATAPSDADRIYVLCQGRNSNDVTAIFRSSNVSGNSRPSWTSLNVPRIIDQGSNSIFTRSQAWYDLIAAVDPNNANVVFIGGIDGLRSFNSGNSWEQITTWSLFRANGFSSAQNVHADHHAFVFEPGSSTNAIVGTDGGLYYSTNANTRTRKPSWRAKNMGYNVTQFYACATSNDPSNPQFLAGAQDNGTQYFRQAGLNSTIDITGGDGAFCHIDQDEPNIQIGATQFNSNRITNNSWQSADRVSFNDGLFITPSDYDSKNNVLYTGGDGEYFVVTNVGSLNRTQTKRISAFSRAVSAITVSPNTDFKVFVGLTNGRVYSVENAIASSSSVQEITPDGAERNCSAIAVETGNDEHLLVTYSNYGVTSVFESTNGGLSWQAVEGNLPDMPIRWVIFNPQNSDQALLATELGVWSTTNLDGTRTRWSPTNESLANTRVDMLQVRPADNLVLAATHGRGLFTTSAFSSVLVDFEDAFQVIQEATAVDECLGYTDIQIGIRSKAAVIGEAIQIEIQIDDELSSAKSGQDYELLTPIFSYERGGQTVQPITIRVFDDTAIEGQEVIALRLQLLNAEASGATLGQTREFFLVIEDNDVDPTAVNGKIEVIGQEETTSAQTGVTPFNGSSVSQRFQQLITVEELQAAGFSTDAISELSFFITEKNSIAPYNVSVKLTPTRLANFSGVFTSSRLGTEVFNGQLSTQAGWTTIVFDRAFQWDGTSNLLLELCYNNDFASSADQVALYASTTNQVQAAARSRSACDFPFASEQSSFKPVLQLKSGTRILPATLDQQIGDAFIGANAAHLIYATFDTILARIDTREDAIYGCTTVRVENEAVPVIDRFGVRTTAKRFLIASEQMPEQGVYDLTLYYTAREIEDFLTATEAALEELLLYKTTANTTTLETAATTFTQLPLGDYAFTASFTGAFGDFMLGIPTTPALPRGGTNVSTTPTQQFATISDPFPNPFRVATAVKINVDQSQQVTAQLVNSNGQIVRSLFHSHLEANKSTTFSIEANGLISGLYWLVIKGDFFEERKTVIVE